MSDGTFMLSAHEKQDYDFVRAHVVIFILWYIRVLRHATLLYIVKRVPL